MTLQRASGISTLESEARAVVNIQPERTASNILARPRQGIFKQRVMQIEWRCRITGVHNLNHLVASRCKPWHDSNNEERLNGENGQLLTPGIDHPFDRGSIGFEGSCRLVISPVAHLPSLQRTGIDTRGVVNVGGFTERQRQYLDFHRNSVLLRAARYAVVFAKDQIRDPVDAWLERFDTAAKLR